MQELGKADGDEEAQKVSLSCLVISINIFYDSQVMTPLTFTIYISYQTHLIIIL